MQRPKKMVFNIEHIGVKEINQIADSIGDAHMIGVGEVKMPFVDPKIDRYRTEYFEPVMVVMTEALFYTVLKHPHSDVYMNRMSVGEDIWTFCGLPVAVVKQRTSTSEQWSQVV